MSCVRAFLHTDIARHGGCCAEVEVKQFSPIADRCVPATENRRHMPAEYMGLQLRQSKKLTIVGCRPAMPWYGCTMVYHMVLPW